MSHELNLEAGASPGAGHFSMEGQLARLGRTNHATVRSWIRHLLALAEYLTGRLDRFLKLDPSRTRRLVFVCWGNVNRSAFAAEVARTQGARAASMGLSTTTGTPAFPLAVATAQEMRFDLAAHAATSLADYTFQEGDVLVAMEVRHARRLAVEFPAASVVLLGHWSYPRRIHLHDPHQHSPDYFRTCFVLIQCAVTQLVRELMAADSPCVQP